MKNHGVKNLIAILLIIFTISLVISNTLTGIYEMFGLAILERFHKNNTRSIINNNDENIVLPEIEETDFIPKKIFQTHKRRDLIPEYYLSNLKKLNPGWEYHFYDNDRCLKFLEEEFGTEFSDKFNSFTNGAHKADLWRLCVLYKYGGCYIDADIEIWVPVDRIIKYCKQDLIIPKTSTVLRENLYNALIICKPGNKLIGECLKKIILVEDKYLSYHYLYILNIMGKILDKKIKFKLIEKYEPKSYFNLRPLAKDHYLFIGDKKIGKSKRDDYIK